MAQEVAVTWGDQSSNEDGFSVERSTDGVNFAELAETGSNQSSFVDTSVEYGFDYYYRVRAFNAFGYSGYSGVGSVRIEQAAQEPSPVPLGLPESTIIGSMSKPGASEYDSDLRLHMITASGLGYESVHDQLRFTQVEVDGDFSLTVKVHAFEADGDWARVGLMARESLETDARHASVAVNGLGNFETFIRSAKGAAVLVTKRQAAPSVFYLKVERSNDVVQLSYSKDGTTWSTGSGSSLYMQGKVFLGIALGSQDDGKLSGAVVEILDSDVPAFEKQTQRWPYLLNLPVASVVIGEMDKEGGHDYIAEEGKHILSASGVGYETYLDELRFSKVTLSGDATLTVKVSEYLPDNAWSRAGIMIRQNSDRDSAHLSMLVNGKGEFETICRPVAGASIVTRRGVRAPSVAYLRLEKTGETVRASYSKDGDNWTSLHTELGLVAGSFEIGLAIGSQTDGALSSAVFEVQDGQAEVIPVDVAPTILGKEAQSSVIGQMIDEGSYTFDPETGLHWISASGAGYESVNDELRYTWVKTSGDFTLSAYIDNYTADAGWSRIGLMVRQSLQQHSRHASMAINGLGNFESMTRTVDGVALVAARTGSVSGRGYVRIRKQGDLISFFWSKNGVDWTAMGSSSIAFDSEFLVGLTIGSQTDGKLSSGVIDIVE